ncbi:helix-turn-helix domain-containing protein [Agrilactobacillus yilanensis]|uniref:Helix-turn-helix domain-containing protein n=1 Tax=Agrilactobacillus yilanensis TaxID=2485997 RepID=A0ABW4JC98_9LACO|nr:helix-turn-helix domain-containing protein [Agrilactobacillus yilanensis]
MTTNTIEKRLHALERGVAKQNLTYYKMVEAMAAVSISRNTLKKWFREGLPYSVIDGTTLVKRSDLEAFIDSHVRKA